MENFAEGSATADLAPRRIEALLEDLVRSLGRPGRVLIVPPDFTRFGTGAGEITASLYDRLSRTAKVTILPALGTHLPMSRAEIAGSGALAGTGISRTNRKSTAHGLPAGTSSG